MAPGHPDREAAKTRVLSVLRQRAGRGSLGNCATQHPLPLRHVLEGRGNGVEESFILLDPNSDPRSGTMPVEVDGTLINNMTIQLDQPLKNGEEKVIVRLKNRPKKMTKLYAPEEYILKLAEKDLEELY
ncbi:hypothetical protein [Methanoculleus frigidifontis]|nr:hypothetical protein [Methanoculleus sp. FWC-SCC1]